MTKKQLYILIVFLCGVLIYVLFMPVAVTQAPEATPPEVTDTNPKSNVRATEASGNEEADITTEPEPLTIEGTFVGLLDGENGSKKKFKYMLLNDGVEVLRIDLRPLIGYSDINIIEKLGVDRGDIVIVSGTVVDGKFTVESIK